MAPSTPRDPTGPPVPGRPTGPSAPQTLPGALRRWCTALALSTLAVVAVSQIHPLTPVATGEGRPVPAGSAVVLGLLAVALLAALRGHPRLARTVTWASLVSGAALLVLAALSLVGVTDGAPPDAALVGWRTTGHAAAVHVLLGVALLTTLGRPARLAGVRAVGLIVGVVAPLVALSVHAVRGEAYAFVLGVVPLTVTLAVATLLATAAIATLDPDRWPLRALLQHPSDRVWVVRLLPFVLLVPFVAPLVVAVARATDLAEQPTIALATLLPMVGLWGLVAVTVRGHRRLLREIEFREQQLRTMIDGLPIAVMVRAQDGTLVHHNGRTEAFLTRLGVGVEAIRASGSELMAHVEVVDEHERPFDRDRLPVVAAVRDGRAHDALVGHALPEGGYAWYSVRATPIPLTDGSVGTIVTLDDVTEQQRARLRITIAERSARLTFEHAPIGIAVLAPEGELLRANAALCELLGYPDPQHLAAAGIGLGLLTEDGQEPSGRLLARLADGRERVRVERHLQHADGHRLPTEVSIALVSDDQGRPLHLIVQVVDLSARRELEAELRAAASQDALTGLANRRALTERLRDAQARSSRDGSGIGLLFLDLDGFKAVNDEHGHDTGDRLLVEVGRELLTATRRSDTVCRLGGDEFVILCTPIAGDAGLQDLLERLARVQPTVDVDGTAVSVGYSVGAVLVGDGEDLDGALRRADGEMYRRKRGAATPTQGTRP